MNNMFLLVNLIAISLVVFIVFWFFGAKFSNKPVSSTDVINIVIKDGVYQPALISIPAGKPITLHFMREDANGCASSVIFTQLNFSYQLPMNQVTSIVLPPQQKGEIDFTCQSGMYRGKLLVI